MKSNGRDIEEYESSETALANALGRTTAETYGYVLRKLGGAIDEKYEAWAGTGVVLRK